MSFDFSFAALATKPFSPIENIPMRVESLELVESALCAEKPKCIYDIAKETGRSEACVGSCLVELRAVFVDRNGRNGAKRWVPRGV